MFEIYVPDPLLSIAPAMPPKPKLGSVPENVDLTNTDPDEDMSLKNMFVGGPLFVTSIIPNAPPIYLAGLTFPEVLLIAPST
jgi:hypothetical protein